MIVVAGVRDAGNSRSVRAYTDAGVSLWDYDTGGNTRDVFIDSLNDVYIVGDESGNKNFWKLDGDGNLLSSLDISGTHTFSIDLDSDGNIFIGKSNGTSSGYIATKISSDLGTQTHFQTEDGYSNANSIKIASSDGHIYIGSGGNVDNLTKWDKDDLTNKLWSKDPYTTKNIAVIVELSNNIIIVGFASGTGYEIRVYNPDGSGGSWSYEVGANVNDLVVDDNDNIYIAYSGGIIKLDSDGNELWNNESGKNIFGIAIVEGTVVACGNRESNYSVWVVDADDGTETGFIDTGTDARKINPTGLILPSESILSDKHYSKKLVGVGNDEFWYESSDGVMSELSDATGDIDTKKQLAMFDAFQKVFIANGSNLKVADFINTKIVDANGFTTKPSHGDIVYQAGTDAAEIVVDFITGTTLYGYVRSGTVEETTAITSKTGGAGDTIFPSPDSVTANPHWYDWTSYDNDSTYGSLPNEAYLGCRYSGRCVLSGNPSYPHQWYMSRQGNPWDWVYIANDAQSPVAGNNADAGEIGDVVKALIPYGDDFLMFGCANSMHVLRGDPCFGGSITELSSTVGIFGAGSWCFDDAGNLYFFGTDGIYVSPLAGGGPGNPQCISKSAIPDIIGDESIDADSHRITMGYDRERNGLIICITKLADGSNSNYFYDLNIKGFYPESYPDVCGAYSIFYYPHNDETYKGLLLGCRDGYIRVFDDSATDDDSGGFDTAIDSYAVWPIYQMGEDDKEGRLTSLTFELAGGGTSDTFGDTNTVDYEIHVGDDAETVLETIMDGGTARESGTLIGIGDTGGKSRHKIRKRVRGAYLGLKLGDDTDSKTWSINRILADIKRVGKVK